MNQTTARYQMNPAEDVILFGDEIADGMWVLPEDETARIPHGDSEETQIRRQRFRRVTRLRREPGYSGQPSRVIFVGEWVDGYQETHRYGVNVSWLVKKPVADTDPRPEDAQ